MIYGLLNLYNGKVDVTDPCYDREVWCRMNKIDVEPGMYVASFTTADDCGYDIVSKNQIRHNDFVYEDEIIIEYIGDIGVDAGLCGFFADKPDYDDERWNSLCDEVFFHNNFTYNYEDGVVTATGYGDGCYPVFAEKTSDGKTIGLYVEFV